MAKDLTKMHQEDNKDGAQDDPEAPRLKLRPS